MLEHVLAPAQRQLGGPDLGDVVDQPHEAANPPVCVQVGHVVRAHVAGRAALVDQAVVEGDLLAGEGAFHVGPDRVPRGGPEHLAHVAPANPFGRVTEPAAIALVAPHVARVGVDDRR